jgi:hypothetical protein
LFAVKRRRHEKMGVFAMKRMEYRLELCDTSGKHRPVAIFRSSSPFPPVTVGDRFDDEGWPRTFDREAGGSPEEPRR